MRDLFFLTCGTFRVPAALVSPPPRLGSLLQTLPFSNTIAVIVRDDGDVVLVDAGWSEEACADPRRVIGALHSRVLGMVTRPEDAVVAQLAARGIDRSRVRTIVATHLHLDHVGGALDFPNAELVTTGAELAAYRAAVGSSTGRKRKGYRAEDLARHGRLREVRLDAAPTYGFPAAHDLFGDGEVVLLDASGHTAGALAVAIRPREHGGRAYVHVGDAAYKAWEWGLGPAGPSLFGGIIAWRKEPLLRTYRAIRDCEADPRKPTIVPSHDHDVFDRLPHAPPGAAVH